MVRHPASLSLGILALAALATVALVPWIGELDPEWQVLFRPGGTDQDAIVFWQIRVPRVGLSFLAGSGLALGGLVFQAVFRNPLATPFTFGVAGGASLGVALFLHFGSLLALPALLGPTTGAFLGAVLSIALVYGIARRSGNLSPNTMLLGGVAISFIFSSLILLLQYFGDLGLSFRIIRWLMGDLSRASLDSILQILPFVASGAAVTFLLRRELDILSIDDELAASRGVSVERVRFILFLAVSLTVTGVVVTCGPIGFVGIMTPHICRMILGASHRVLIPATILTGGIFLTLCDTLARSLAANAEVPVGIITTLLGGPFFLWILFSRSAYQS